MRRFVELCAVLLLAFGCGSEGTESDNSDDAQGGSEMIGSCFTSQECLDSQYCRATDAAVSPDGTCVSLELEGGDCVFGTQCATGLTCVKTIRASSGTCEAFPESCVEEPTCMCALTLCDALEGSSCSASDLNDPGSSITVSCAE